MQEMFDQLMSSEKEEEILEAEKFFLDKTKEAAEADFKANAFDITAQFDEFRRLARDEYSKPFYAGFFATLSEMIKKHQKA